MTGSRPTQADFHDLIDSFFNHMDDAFENFGLTLYNSERIYNTNDTCIYNGCIYICIENNISGPFNLDRWDYITEVPAIYLLNQWQNDINYNQYDVVRYKGKAYYSKLNNNIGNIPTKTTWWQEVICNKQNMVNWQPGIYFKNQKVIYNNNVYQVNCDAYILSINTATDISTGILLPILQKKYISILNLVCEVNVIDFSNNYIIEIGDIENFKNGEKVVVKSSTNKYSEVSIYNEYQSLKWRIKEALTESSYSNLYSFPNLHNIIVVNKEKMQFTIAGTVSFEFGFIQVKESSDNNGFYIINNLLYQSGTTIITVNESINSNTIDGIILQYTGYNMIYSTNKLNGCIIKVSDDNEIRFRSNKYINYKSKNYELLALNHIENSYELTINASSLSSQEPYGTCLYGYTTQLPHNLNDYYFNYQIYNNERETVTLESLRLKALDLNNAEIDVKDPTKYPNEEHTIILIS
ncbi:MAG: hypothetical protein HPY79_11885 [Bacteroidales bacterium]|nr:hypothetical protein [Bacteroidales bacterium]